MVRLLLFSFIIILMNSIIFSQSSTLDDAIKLVDKEQYREAAKLLESYLNDYPDNPEAHYFLGMAYDRISFCDGEMMQADVNYSLKSSAEFRKVIEIAPKYRGRIRIQDPYSKLTSVWGALAAGYAFKGQADSAEWAFRSGQDVGAFYPEILEYNRNVMASCAPNAILFTNGDNDTFPAWYLQMIEHYRRDINIVNCSLLNAYWYIKAQKRGDPFSDNPVKISVPYEEIDSIAPIWWNSKRVSINVPNTGAEIDSLMKMYDVDNPSIISKGQLDFIMPPTLFFDEGTAVRIQDLLVEDVILTNNWERPVYFAITCSQENFIGLIRSLRLDGLALKLVPLVGSAGKPFLSENRIRENLEKYTYCFPVNKDLFNSGFKYSSWNYMHPYLELADYYDRKGEYQKVISILDEMIIKLPIKLMGPEDDVVRAISNLYVAAGDSAKAEAFLKLVGYK